MFEIKDWTGRVMNFGQFKTFDDAEQFLFEKLGDNYDTDRQEYFIEYKSSERD